MLADWTGAIISFVPPDYQGENEIAEASVTITYWAAAADVPTPLSCRGTGGSARSLPASSRRVAAVESKGCGFGTHNAESSGSFPELDLTD